MKIVCDNCSTKYSIGDDKVRGKTFKIRCKKCSHVIVVRGSNESTTPAAEEPAPEAAPANYMSSTDFQESASSGGLPAGDAVWHVVVGRDQVGPLSAEEVRAKFAAGEIDGETYAWRDGFGDWQRLVSIDDFRDLAPQGSGVTTVGGMDSAAPRTSSADELLAHSQRGDDATAASSDPFGELNTTISEGGMGQGAPAASGPVEPRMTGQRGDNSVLFSLNNLNTLASAKAEQRPGFATSQSEGSGLIDIRAMAASTLSAPQRSESNKDSVPTFNSVPPVFSPMAAPIVLPTPQQGAPKWLWFVVVPAVLAIAAMIALLVTTLNKKELPVTPPVVAVAPKPAAPPPVAATPTPAAPPVGAAPAAAPPVAAAGAPAAAAPLADATAADKKKKLTPVEKKQLQKAVKGQPGAPAAPAAAAAAAAPEAPPVAAAPPRRAARGSDEIDALLNGASPDRGGGHAAREEASDENLPEELDKSAILSGISGVKGRVSACNEQYKVPGMVSVSITIAKSGRVSSANVTGAFAGTPTGDCVSRAVKTATFPKFKGSPQTFTYPYNFR